MLKEAQMQVNSGLEDLGSRGRKPSQRLSDAGEGGTEF